MTGGYIGEKARERFYGNIDSLNGALKGFREEFYHQLCLARLEPVLESLRWFKHETEMWFQVTILLIPGEKSSEQEAGELSDWMAENLCPDGPLHSIAFHSDFKIRKKPRTRPHTLQRVREQGLKSANPLVFLRKR